jgi:hypothetical protein
MRRLLTVRRLAGALRLAPDIVVSNNGNFDKIDNLKKVAAKLSTETADWVPDLAAKAPATGELTSGTIETLAFDFTPVFIASRLTEDYNLETAAWIGATLEQGVWYTMSAGLIMPGLEGLTIEHDVRFAFTRDVPCTPQSADKACVEIVVRATPDPEALKSGLENLGRFLKLQSGQAVRYWSSTLLRLVVKPDTLQPYLSDTRRSWYLAVDGPVKNDPVIGDERIVSTVTYH